MSRLVGQHLYGGNLTKSQAHSSVAALCDVPRVIGGSNRLYYEHTLGKVPGGSDRCAPLSASGRVGHDHTGAGFGRPLKHSVYSVSYPDVADWEGSNVTPPCILRGAGDSAPWGRAVTTYIVPVPAGYAGSEYETLSAMAVFNCTIFNSNVTLTGDIWSELAHGNGTGSTWSIALTAAGFYAFSSAVVVPVQTGAYNRIKLRFTIESAATTEVYLQAFTLAQLT